MSASECSNLGSKQQVESICTNLLLVVETPFRLKLVLAQASSTKLRNKMAPSVKIVYFPAKGRAELTRFVLAVGGQPWNEEVISFEKWGTMKEGRQFDRAQELISRMDYGRNNGSNMKLFIIKN